MTTESPKPFAVTLWCSHPDLGNDDCHSGADFDCLEEAEKAFDEPVSARWTHVIAFIVLTGPDGLQRVRENPGYDAKAVARERARDDSAWQRERAMQAGMAFGIGAYNEEMGE